jgi:hypothetical protein
VSCSVTRDAFGRGLESCEMPTHLWTARGTRPLAVENRSLPAGSYRKLVTPDPVSYQNRSLALGKWSPTTSNSARRGLGVTGCVTSARRVTVTDEVASYARVTSTEIGLSASTQLMPPVIRPTARRSSSTARRFASDSAEP